MMIFSSLKASLKGTSVAALSAVALTLGLGSTAMAQMASITALTQGIDSGLDSVAEELAATPGVQQFFAVAAAQLGNDATLGDVLANPQFLANFASPQVLAALQPIQAVLQTNPDPSVVLLLSQPLAEVQGLLMQEAQNPDDFFQIGFNVGPLDAFIESVTFELGSDFDAAFDNQDFFAFDASPEVGFLLGLNEEDISFSPVSRNDFANPNPTTRLTISFAEGSFGVGDSFGFGVDTNAVGNDIIPLLAPLSVLTNDALATFNDSGLDFGLAGVTFSVTLENGQSGEGIFAVNPLVADSPLASVANVSFEVVEPQDVPEPGTLAALFIVLAGATQLGQRQTRKQS